MIRLTARELVNGDLEISVERNSKDEFEELALEDADSFDSDAAMYDVFEPLICNSDYSWVFPEDCGDLTSAPMLGILGEESPDAPYPRRFAGRWNGKAQYQTIEKRWGFMDYALTSPQRMLLDTGRCVFTAPR